MVDKYGAATVDACIDELLNMADRHMRSLIKTVPDGTYSGTVPLSSGPSVVTIRADGNWSLAVG